MKALEALRGFKEVRARKVLRALKALKIFEIIKVLAVLFFNKPFFLFPSPYFVSWLLLFVLYFSMFEDVIL